MSTYGTTRHHPTGGGGFNAKERIADYNTTLFRRLTWDGTVPIEVRVDSMELPANSDRGLECYYLQAPRVSYLPLLMPQIRQFFMELVFDETAAKDLKDEDWWFETEHGSLVKWHWPLGLIYDNHTITASTKASSSRIAPGPLRLTLHLASPPNDKLLLSPTPDACKSSFMGQLKEADFIRWGNTRRMTGLRKAEQDGIWDGIREHDFDDYWRVAAKITPTTAPGRSISPAPPPSSTSVMHTRPPSADPGGSASTDKESAYSVRSVPVRIYLPDGPVLQDLVPPVLQDGAAHTLHDYLTSHIPLLFPPKSSPQTPDLGYPLVQGVVAPLDSEIAWLGACLSGADGWLNICVGLNHSSSSSGHYA